MRRSLHFACVIALTLGCADAPLRVTAPNEHEITVLSQSAAGVPSHAVVTFGRTNTGTAFPPAEHDRSFHSYDKVVPYTVVIAAGGSVTFNTAPFHWVAIYEPGVGPDDLTITPATLDDLVVPFPPFLIPDFIINDPTDRVVRGPALAFAPTSWTTPPGTFNTPGKYLVICQVLPHFAFARMYAYVEVK